MKKRIIALLLAVMLIVPCMAFPTSANGVPVWNGKAASGFAGGTGSYEDPYVIETAEQLAFLAKSVNEGNSYGGKYISLENNIILNDVSNLSDFENWDETPPANEWTPIGSGWDCPFSGGFMGNGYEVAGMYISSDAGYCGLFGYVGNDLDTNSDEIPIICDLLLQYSYVNSPSGYVGTLAGVAEDAFIEDCVVEYAQLSATGGIGGIASRIRNTCVHNCYAEITVDATKADYYSGGGIVHEASSTNMSSVDGVFDCCCSVDGKMAGLWGGICGKVDRCRIANCAAYSEADCDKDRMYGVACVFENDVDIGTVYYNFDACAESRYGTKYSADGLGNKSTFKNFNFGDYWYISENLFCGLPYYENWFHMTVYLPFVDVPVGSWYTEAALFCNTYDLMSGTSENTFSPNVTLTRAQFVQILMKLAQGLGMSDTSAVYENIFDDVPENKWYTNAVMWAVQRGITGGMGNRRFAPDAGVTRAQLAMFLYAFSEKSGFDMEKKADLSVYSDEKSVANWAKTAMSWAVGNGLISGTSKTTLSPETVATRAQTAVIIKGYLENYVLEHSVYRFDPDGGTCDVLFKIVRCGKEIGELPLPVKEGCKFDGWWTADGVRVKATDVCDVMHEEIYLTAHWVQGNKVTFDPAGGECEEKTRYVLPGDELGFLPEPVLEGRFFAGWYFTDPISGESKIVNFDTVIDVDYDYTLTAHWWTEADILAKYGLDVKATAYVNEMPNYDGTKDRIVRLTFTQNGSVEGEMPEMTVGAEISDSPYIFTEKSTGVFEIKNANPVGKTLPDFAGGETLSLRVCVIVGDEYQFIDIEAPVSIVS